MALIDTLFDVLSASFGAICGAVFAFFLNRRRNRRMANEQIISRRELDTIRQENQRLLQEIKDKENIILKMQIQLLELTSQKKKSTKK
ncbi:MAG: hypothetical protein R8N24_02410 [Alphaproteobacteria bacterium]|nr:hypothetical protein [Alphaproteobacteria bacterium]